MRLIGEVISNGASITIGKVTLVLSYKTVVACFSPVFCGQVKHSSTTSRHVAKLLNVRPDLCTQEELERGVAISLLLMGQEVTERILEGETP